MESETLSKNFSSYDLKSHCSLMHDFETSYIGHMKNRGSWLYIDRSSNVENFHYIMLKITDSNRQPVQNTGGELRVGNRKGQVTRADGARPWDLDLGAACALRHTPWGWRL